MCFFPHSQDLGGNEFISRSEKKISSSRQRFLQGESTHRRMEMKDKSKERLIAEHYQSGFSSALEGVEFCLEALFDDTEHNFRDDINSRLTFEELIDALLCAQKALQP